MKRVVGTSDVAHLWANKVQSDARNQGSNFYFNGDTIYSYGRHFAIAVHHEDKVIMTTRDYSTTTSKHKWEVRKAASHIEMIYCAYPERAVYGNHRDNFNEWKKEVQGLLDKLAVARKPEKYQTPIDHIKSQVDAYCNHFQVEIDPDLNKMFDINANSDKLEAIRERQRIANKEKREQQKQEEAEIKEGYDQFLNAWRNGYDSLSGNDQYTWDVKSRIRKQFGDGNIKLRVIGSDIQTSKDVKIPVGIAQRYYQQWLEGKLRYGSKIMDFQVTKSTPEVLVVGCHTIPASEIEYIANLLGWGVPA